MVIKDPAQPGSAGTPLIDASVHVFFGSNKDLRQNFLKEPFASRGFPDYEMNWYGAPGGEYAKDTKDPTGSTPAPIPTSPRSICSPTAAWTSQSCTR